MLEKDVTLEEKMTPEERELFDKFKQQIGKEFLIEECLTPKVLTTFHMHKKASRF